MKRNPEALANGEFDVLVVGAGMFGACVAWSAVLRGYSVAIIDKADFAHATSSNHYKFIHGGIRYLQHADIVRTRESSRERSALVRIAPHLAYPMPIVLPTYGHGKKGRLIMQAGMLAYDVFTADRNRGIRDRTRRTPMGSVLGRDEVLQLFPGVKRDGLTGAAVFHDGQMYNPARLVLAFVKSAQSRGAVPVNYIQAEQFVLDGDRVTGCRVRDHLTGETFEVRSRITINAAGPWAARELLHHPSLDFSPKPGFSRDLAFVIDRPISRTHALGCQAQSHDSDALLDRGGRHLFLVPWRGKTLVGVWHRYSKASPDHITVSREELRTFLSEINGAYAGLDLRLDDIRMINTGLILFGSEDDQASSSDHSFAKRSVLVDHGKHGVEGLISLIGARATVARGVGDQTLDLVDRKIASSKNRPNSGKSASEWEKIHGGNFDDFASLVTDVNRGLPELSRETATAVAHNYGAAWTELVDGAPDASYLQPAGQTNVLKAEALHAVRDEMATSLADIVFRRTELGTGGDPGADAIRAVADIAGQEFGWTEEKRDAEIRSVTTILQQLGPWHMVDTNADLPSGE